MKCMHKPREIIRAMFTYDSIYTCKHCGKEIWYKADRWEHRHSIQIAVGLGCMFAGLFGWLVAICASPNVGVFATVLLGILFILLANWIYVMVYAEFISDEDEEDQPRRIRLKD